MTQSFKRFFQFERSFFKQFDKEDEILDVYKHIRNDIKTILGEYKQPVYEHVASNIPESSKRRNSVPSEVTGENKWKHLARINMNMLRDNFHDEGGLL